MKHRLLLMAALCSSLIAMGTPTSEHIQQQKAIRQINEDNPNGCLVVTEMHFDQDSIPQEKTDYGYDSDRNISSMHYYEMTDTGWMCTRYDYYQNILIPYDSTIIIYSHERNYETREWLPTVGRKTRETTNGNRVTTEEWTTVDGDTTQWIGKQKREETFDSHGRFVEGINYEMINGQWANAWKYETAYNADGEVSMTASYEWRDGAWKAFDKDEEIKTDTSYFRGSYYHSENYDSLVLMNRVYYRFNNNGDTLLHIWGADGDRIYLKEEYTYENGALTGKTKYEEARYYPYNLVMTEQNYYRTDSQKRVIEKKTITYQYNEIQSRYLELTTYAYADSKLVASQERQDSINSWTPTSKTEYTYNNDRLLLTKITSAYDVALGKWLNDQKQENVYYQDDMILYSANYSWSVEENRWQGNDKYETEYNADGVAVSSIDYIMYPGDTTWTPQRAVVRSFDIYGNFLGEGWYRRNENTGEWMNLGKQLFVYICGDLPTPAQPVIVEPGHDFVTFAWLSYEDADTYTLTILSSNRTDTIAIMNFNSFGELIEQTAPAGVARRTASPSSSSVFTCQIENLDTGKNYYYVMEAKNEQKQVIHSENGAFQTGDNTAIEYVAETGSDNEKVIRDGMLLIYHNGQWYNTMGQPIE